MIAPLAGTQQHFSFTGGTYQNSVCLQPVHSNRIPQAPQTEMHFFVVVVADCDEVCICTFHVLCTQDLLRRGNSITFNKCMNQEMLMQVLRGGMQDPTMVKITFITSS